MSTTHGGSSLESLQTSLAGLAATNATDLSDELVREGVAVLVAAGHQVSALLSVWAGVFQARGLAQDDGFRSTRTWLTSLCRLSPGAATGVLRRAPVLRELPALAAAAVKGVVSGEQLAKVDALARRVGLARVVEFDEILAELSSVAGPRETQRACERIAAYLDPDGGKPDPVGDYERREITFSRVGSMFTVKGQLDPEAGAALMSAVDALMRPPGPDDTRTAAQRRADALVELARQALIRGELPSVGGVRPRVGILLTPTMLLGTALATPVPTNTTTFNSPTPNGTALNGSALNGSALNGSALNSSALNGSALNGPAPGGTALNGAAFGDAALNGAALNGPAPGGTALNGSALNGLAGAGGGSAGLGPSQPDAAVPRDRLAEVGVPPLPDPPWLHWFGDIPTEIAQRVACDSSVWRIVLDPATGLPLDVGRTKRIVPHWIRQALHARDRTCRWPGCDTPAAWTDAHHYQLPWYLGGQTNINELVSLCRHHHVLVHEGHWTLTLNPDTGNVTITRPNGTPYEIPASQPYRPNPT